jgi:hypothetical protein
VSGLRSDGDPVVQAALQLLPVPDHGDTFWADLADRLDAADGVQRRPAAPAVSVFALASAEPVVDPTPVPSPRPKHEPRPVLATIPPAMRRRSNAVLAAVAVAALLVAGVAGAALVRADEGGSSDAVAEGGQAPQPDDPVTTSKAAGVPTGLTKDDVTASKAAATTYAADHAGSGGQDWTQVLVTPVASGKTESLAVVTLIGAAGTETYAVRLTDDGAEVVPEDTAGSIELVTPGPVDDGTLATVDRGDDLVVVLPAGASAPVLRIDDGTPVICGEADGTHFAAMDDVDRARCAWSPTSLAPGAHTLTVAFTDTDGAAISADSVAFQAA